MKFYIIFLLLTTRYSSTVADDEESSSDKKNCVVKYYYCCDIGHDWDGKLICLKNCPRYNCESDLVTTTTIYEETTTSSDESTSEINESSTDESTTPKLEDETTQLADEVDLDKPTEESESSTKNPPSIKNVNLIMVPQKKCPNGQQRDHRGKCQEPW